MSRNERDGRRMMTTILKENFPKCYTTKTEADDETQQAKTSEKIQNGKNFLNRGWCTQNTLFQHKMILGLNLERIETQA